jgi:phage tail sheath protein FI
MPITPTYPGVYIEEISSGVRTIIGVPTSVTAFIGRSLRGPINEPTIINSFGDFERQFGSLNVDYPMSYAIRDFYQNGGKKAVILRLFDENSLDKIAKFSSGDLKLEASSPGKWGNRLSIKIDHQGITDDVAKQFSLAAADLFNLTIVENPPRGPRERINNVSLKTNSGARRLDRALVKESTLVRVQMAGDEPSGISDDAARPDETRQANDPTNLNAELDNVRNFEGGDDSELLEPKNFELQKDENGDSIPKTGLFALDKADIFNLLCIPPEVRNFNTDSVIYQLALPYCVENRAMLIIDPPIEWGKVPEVATNKTKAAVMQDDLGLAGPNGRNAILYFPRVIQADPLREGQLDTFVACGIIAGLIARTDEQRGVWKAPAGIDASLNGIRGLQVNLTDPENGELNPLGVNCLRNFPVYGRVAWGARTLRGADQLADEYKYIPVRRLLLFMEETLYRNLQWVVFEPNDEPLWSQIRLNVGAFLNDLFRKGAFQGKTPRDAYFVKCDSETTTQTDINSGIVNIVVGFAPLKPAEFVIIKFQQIAGQIAT